VTGVYPVEPTMRPPSRHRERIWLGPVRIQGAREVWSLLGSLACKWLGREYHPLKHNCIHFCAELCECLGVQELPSWVGRVAEAAGYLIAPLLDGVDDWEVWYCGLAVLVFCLVATFVLIYLGILTWQDPLGDSTPAESGAKVPPGEPSVATAPVKAWGGDDLAKSPGAPGRLPHEAGGVTGACLNWPNTQWRGWYYVRAFDPDPKIRGLSISFESKESWHEGEASQEFGSHSEVAYDGFEPEGTYLVPRGCHDARTQAEAIESCSWADEREQCGPNSRPTTYMWELPQCETPDQTTPCARVPPWGGPVMSLCWSWHTTSIQGGVLGRV